MCAELDVVEAKVAEDDDGYVILRMTWAQHKAYRDGRFTPRYVPGSSPQASSEAETGEIVKAVARECALSAAGIQSTPERAPAERGIGVSRR